MIIITGGAGFIGSNIAAELSKKIGSLYVTKLAIKLRNKILPQSKEKK